MTKNADAFTLSFGATTTNKDWFFPLRLRENSASVSMKDPAEPEDSGKYANEWRFRQHKDLTIMTEGESFYFDKPQRYRKQASVETSGAGRFETAYFTSFSTVS